MEQYFAVMFEDFGHERSLKILLSLTDPNLIQEAKFTDPEIKNIKNAALEKLQRQRRLKEEVAIALLEHELE